MKGGIQIARPRSFSEDELLEMTEQLLIERGYDAFNLKVLAEALDSPRSTIYGYFANKEEIIAACMRRTMEKILTSCETLEEVTDPVEAIKAMLTIFMRQAHFHALMQVAPEADETTSEKAKADIIFLDEGHHRLKALLLSYFEQAQQLGKLRDDLPLPIIIAVFFHAIETPNWLQLPADQFAEQLFALWWHGVKQR